MVRSKRASYRTLFLLVGLFACSTEKSAAPKHEQWPSDAWLSAPLDDAAFARVRSLSSYDRALPLDVKIIRVEETETYRREHISYSSTPGERVFAYYYVPKGVAEPPPAAVLVLHGGRADGKEAECGLGLVDSILEANLALLVIDMKYFGERKTGLMEQFTPEEKHEVLYNNKPRYRDWVIQTIRDAGRGYDFLVQERHIDPKRIGVTGFSRGAQLTMIVAGADERFAAAAPVLGGHFGNLEYQHEAEACPANYIMRIAPRPLFLLNAERDEDYDKTRSVLPLHALTANHPDRTVEWVDTKHEVPAPPHLARVARWLAEKLLPLGAATP